MSAGAAKTYVALHRSFGGGKRRNAKSRSFALVYAHGNAEDAALAMLGIEPLVEELRANFPITDAIAIEYPGELK